MSWPFFSAQQFADMNLPGFYPDKSSIIRYAQREGWIVKDRWNRWGPSYDRNGNPLSQKRAGKGGGWEYHYVLLPGEAYDHFVNLHVEKEVETGELVEAVDFAFKKAPDTLSQLNQWQRDVMEARLGILRWVEENSMRGGRKKAIRDLTELCKSNRIPSYLRDLLIQANAKSGQQSGQGKAKVGRSTVYEWFAKREKYGVAGLAPDLTKVTDFSIPDWGWAFLDLYRNPNKPAIAAIIEKLPEQLPANVCPPSRDQAERFLKKLAPVALHNGRMGPQALKSMKAFTRRGTEELWPTAVYSADGHTFKSKIEHPFHGQPFLPEVTAVIDIYSRYIPGWSVALAENSIGVLEALSVSIVEHDDGRHRGLPAIWYTDNGSGFRAKIFEDAGTGFYDRWGITAKNSLPYNSQARGVIERLNRSIWTPLSKTFETYQGKDADKEALREIRRITDKELRANRRAPFAITWEEFKQQVQQAIDDYNNRPHSSLPRYRDPETLRYRHMTPKEVWDKWLEEGGENRLIPKDEAADLIRPYERRKTLRGEVRILGNIYFSFDLEQWHGEEVMVGYNIHDASKVWVRNFEGVLLAVAELDGNRRQYFGDDVIKVAMSKQDKVLESRTKSRLNLVDKKREEILEEAKGLPLEVEYQPMEQAPALTEYDRQVGDEAFAKLEKRNEPKAEREAIPGTRPIFSNEVQLAKWLLQNPDQATEKDARLFKEKLRGSHFRQLLEFEDVPPDLLETIIAKTAVSNT